jgi:mycothiol synthase
VDLHVRAFQDADYRRLADIEAAIDPSVAHSAETLRERDAIHEPRTRALHLAADNASGQLIAAARTANIWWNFHPKKFLMRIVVDPAWQRQGTGSALLDRILEQLHAWDAELVRTESRDHQHETIAFLEHRGFRELRRRWESVLQVATANTAALDHAQKQALASGVRFTRYRDELMRRGPELAHEVWELERDVFRDDSSNTAEGEGMGFERFVATELESSGALADGHFLAYVGDQLVGLSRTAHDVDHPRRLDQGFTATHPDFRGRGLAQALKLRTIEYAREHGYQEIVTTNDSTNEPMLHINDSIGFRRGPAIVIFERRLQDESANRLTPRIR